MHTLMREMMNQMGAFGRTHLIRAGSGQNWQSVIVTGHRLKKGCLTAALM